MKRTYLDIIQKSLGAYGELSAFAAIEQTQDIQSYSRILSSLCVMLDNGRMTQYKDVAQKMLDIALDSLVKQDVMTDFAVKELMLAFKLQKNWVKLPKLVEWKQRLTEIDPYAYYKLTLQTTPPEKLHNINVYNMAGEYLRETEGMCDTTAYFREHMPCQLKRFDEKGMYHDPGSPMLYDIAARVQVMLMLWSGYRGEYAATLDGLLRMGGMATLYTQSAKFEFPYGGRSNQYLFNEALLCSVAEYEATRYNKEGDLKMAGMFKRMAHLAVQSIERWLCATPPRHIKNFYPAAGGLGTEEYGYYQKYMISLGNFIYPAFLFADDEIRETACPAETGGYVYELPRFHKVFANCGKYSVEVDTCADPHYDATGLGRIHHKDFPSELGLSVPFAKEPGYKILGENCALSLCAGWEENGEVRFLSGVFEGISHKTFIEKQSEEETMFTIRYAFENNLWCQGITEQYRITEQSVKIHVSLQNPNISKIYFTVPVFLENGRDLAETKLADNKVETISNGVKYTAVTDGALQKSTKTCFNRNGKYQIAVFEKTGAQMNVELSFAHSGDFSHST